MTSPNSSNMLADVIRITIGVLLCLSWYFVPMGIAVLMRHPRWMAITMVNLLAGWTVIGWVIALVWATMDDRRVA